MIKSFRGMILDGGQETIRLSTNTGKIGYRIVKFQVMPESTGSGTNEAMVSVWNNKQDAAIQDVNFNDPSLLAAAMFLRGSCAAVRYLHPGISDSRESST